ncbi:MAG: FAD-dependent oxidoreductase [Hyphomicrobiales bacterium]|nr:FAD-dependent oxidoreductase [Hyphomicrobiales bacterium]
MLKIDVHGAGVVGVWQALTLARAGHAVRLIDSSPAPFAAGASRRAAAMIAPYCEAEAGGPLILEWGLRSLALWREHHPDLVRNGTLVVAAPRDRPELTRFARLTQNWRLLGRDDLASLEPSLGERHAAALFYADEAHVEPAIALPQLLRDAQNAGCEVAFGADVGAKQSDLSLSSRADWIIDCRGMAAAPDLPGLRGVRGEMAVIASGEVRLSRPVRLLHPRFPLYIAPWAGGRFMVGATVIESSDPGTVTVRSALDLLAAALAVHPAFAEARIEGLHAEVRPAFSDNLPRIIASGRRIHVNGVHRHGFLLAPALAEMVRAYVETGAAPPAEVTADVTPAA